MDISWNYIIKVGIQYTPAIGSWSTVEPPLMDTSSKQTSPMSGHQAVVLIISLLKLYIGLTSHKRTPLASRRGHPFGGTQS